MNGWRTAMVVVLLLTGCGDDGGGSEPEAGLDAGVDSGADTDTGSDTGVATIELEVAVIDEIYATIPDVVLCWDGDTAACETTADGGLATLVVPADSAGTIDATGDGRYPTRSWIVTGDEDSQYVVPSLTEAALADIHEAGGDEIDPTRGSVLLLALSSGWTPMADVVFALDPPSGHGPVYMGLGLTPDLESTTTTIAGAAYVANADPGECEVTAEMYDGPCRLAVAAEPGPALIDVVADTTNTVLFFCD